MDSDSGRPISLVMRATLADSGSIDPVSCLKNMVPEVVTLAVATTQRTERGAGPRLKPKTDSVLSHWLLMSLGLQV